MRKHSHNSELKLSYPRHFLLQICRSSGISGEEPLVTYLLFFSMTNIYYVMCDVLVSLHMGEGLKAN